MDGTICLDTFTPRRGRCRKNHDYFLNFVSVARKRTIWHTTELTHELPSELNISYINTALSFPFISSAYVWLLPAHARSRVCNAQMEVGGKKEKITKMLELTCHKKPRSPVSSATVTFPPQNHPTFPPLCFFGGVIDLPPPMPP